MNTPKAPYVSDEGLVTLHRKHRGKPGALLREIRDLYEIRLAEVTRQRDELLGAISAAEVEGFSEHLANGRSDLALEIYDRRIGYAFTTINPTWTNG